MEPLSKSLGFALNKICFSTGANDSRSPRAHISAEIDAGVAAPAGMTMPEKRKTGICEKWELYSYRNASIGSMLDARLAGTRQASAATASIRKLTANNTIGLRELP